MARVFAGFIAGALIFTIGMALAAWSFSAAGTLRSENVALRETLDRARANQALDWSEVVRHGRYEQDLLLSRNGREIGRAVGAAGDTYWHDTTLIGGPHVFPGDNAMGMGVMAPGSTVNGMPIDWSRIPFDVGASEPEVVRRSVRNFSTILDEGKFGVFASEPMVQLSRTMIGLLLVGGGGADMQMPAEISAPSRMGMMGLLDEPVAVDAFDVMVAEIEVDEDDFELHSRARRTFALEMDGTPEDVFWSLTPLRSGHLSLTIHVGVDQQRFSDLSSVPPPEAVTKIVQVVAEPITTTKIEEYARANWREILNYLVTGMAGALGMGLLWLLQRIFLRRGQGG